MSNADTLLRDLLSTIGELCREHRPMLKSVTMHPDDYTALYNHAAVKATTPEGHLGWLGPMTIRGVAIYSNPLVPRGEPWYDPPEAGPRMSRSPQATPGGSPK